MLREILRKIKDGELPLDEAEKAIKLLAIEEVNDIARLDIHRELRHGVPEVVIAEGKSVDNVIEIAGKALQKTGRIIISRANDQQVNALTFCAIEGKKINISKSGSTVVLSDSHSQRRATGGRVGIITAGTSDIPVAQEAEIMASEMGCDVTVAYDVGIAGIHRIFMPLKEMINKDIDVLVVVAGREGALPTLLAGLIDVPIIAVPTSFGYGFGEKGTGALMAMLQSCSLGLAAVNIDGGIPAGAVAALIANRVARFREKKSSLV